MKNNTHDARLSAEATTLNDPTNLAKAERSTHNEPARILIVNVNWLGDVLFSTPFIRTIRAAYPNSFIACMIPPRCFEILNLNPSLDEVITYDEKEKHSSIIGKLRFILGLRKKKFDVVFLLHRSFTKTLFTYLVGIKERIGYYTEKRAFLLTKAIEPPFGGMHKVDYFLNIAEAVGITNYTREYEFFIRDEDRAYVSDLLKSEGISESNIIIVINPGGNWKPKRWPMEHFATLSDRLIEEFGAKIAITGAEKDKTLADKISSQTKRNKEVINLCGKTSLKQLGALLERANLVIANDTGPMHIAIAMQTPTIALFGPTSPHITGPYGKGRFRVLWKVKECTVPCYDMSCIDNECMKLISVEDVMGEVRKILCD